MMNIIDNEQDFNQLINDILNSIVENICQSRRTSLANPNSLDDFDYSLFEEYEANAKRRVSALYNHRTQKFLSSQTNLASSSRLNAIKTEKTASAINLHKSVTNLSSESSSSNKNTSESNIVQTCGMAVQKASVVSTKESLLKTNTNINKAASCSMADLTAVCKTSSTATKTTTVDPKISKENELKMNQSKTKTATSIATTKIVATKSVAQTSSSSSSSTVMTQKKEQKAISVKTAEKAEESICSSLERITIKAGPKKLTKHEMAIGYGFNDEQIAVFEETFQILDKDSNGYLTLQEIREVMNSLGYSPSDDFIRQKIKDIDRDNSGTVDFEEFICMMSTFRKVRTPNELDEELKEIFELFDRNNDGFIDKNELKDMLTRLGEHITDDEVVDMIREADTDGDLKVSFLEFRSILSENKSTSR